MPGSVRCSSALCLFFLFLDRLYTWSEKPFGIWRIIEGMVWCWSADLFLFYFNFSLEDIFYNFGADIIIQSYGGGYERSFPMFKSFTLNENYTNPLGPVLIVNGGASPWVPEFNYTNPSRKYTNSAREYTNPACEHTKPCTRVHQPCTCVVECVDLIVIST